MATTTDARFARAQQFERELSQAAAALVIQRPWGCAYLRPELHQAYAENFCWAFRPPLDAATLIADADELMAGLAHRQLRVDGDAAEALLPDFRAAGWSPDEHHVYMAHDGSEPRGEGAEEVSVDDVLPAVRRYLRSWTSDEIVTTHLAEHHRIYAAGRKRVFGVVRGGEVVAYANLFTGDGIAQVEDVVVLAEHRGRGYGRAVVAEAMRAAGRPELLFIVAEVADWPRELYARMGFAPMGTARLFRRTNVVTAQG